MEALQAIAKRKSTRSYTTEQISDRQLETLLFAADAAPKAGGAEGCVHISVIQNKELLRKLIQAAATAFCQGEGYTPFYGAPTLLVISGNNETPYGGAGANVACAGENVLIAATALGLGSVYLTGFLAAFSVAPELIKEVGVPEGFTPLAGVIVGNTAEKEFMEKEFKVGRYVNYVK
ncbi:nitroreductase A [Pelotomaculum sp. FP]|uniref:nitroreductase family protein n=1 Tax=Pelotomaculum sp. FP TaxID=261474 RepID=UPI00106695D9|nr:nitroreductase family protein [Pelotomaculum sp. FP]TEB15424.1 nitroreductase A [Pelotomaculum sp. FP]